jgi:hypothetical protein
LARWRLRALRASLGICEAAIAGERSDPLRGAWVASLELFARSFLSSDVVAVEATSGTEETESPLQAYSVRVIVAQLKAIGEAKAKTDRLDARKCCPGCWSRGRRMSARVRSGD